MIDKIKISYSHRFETYVPPMRYFHLVVPLYPRAPNPSEEKISVKSRKKYKDEDGIEWNISILGRPSYIDAFAVTFPINGAPLPDSKIRITLNHILTLIRIGYDPEKYAMHENGELVSYTQDSDTDVPSFIYDYEEKVDTRSRTDDFDVLTYHKQLPLSLQNAVDLCIESQLQFLPVHYKLLSLVRAFELLFPDNNDQDRHFAAHKDKYAALEISNEPFHTAVRNLRARCAHGETRTGGAPFVGTAVPDIPNMDKWFQIIRAMVYPVLEERTGIPMPIPKVIPFDPKTIVTQK